MPHRKRRDSRHFDQPRRFGLGSGHALLGQHRLLNDSGAVLVVNATRFGQAELARRTVQELHRQRALQRAHVPARKGFRDAELFRRAGKALGLHHVREHAHAV